MTQGNLEARIKRLEDIEDIKKLRAAFCYAMDSGDWEGVTSLFTEDGIADMGTYGRCSGRAKIAEFAREILPSSLSFMVHMCHNPIIEVEGDEASGLWYFDLPATYTPVREAVGVIGPPTSRAMWIAGRFEDEYVRVDGEWKFKTFVAKIYYETPFDEGWVRTKIHR
jgi:hypothetical protein